MSRISKSFVFVGVPIGILLGALFAIFTHQFGLGTPSHSVGASYVSRLSTYHIPDTLEFCGEGMPLRDEYVRRRMEQAFYIELSDAQIILDLKRSAVYFPYIEKKLREMNLPQDLKYLPVAESALRNLVSYAGAAGIWQFTRATAWRYGLIVNYNVDERYNFRKATVAALKYLSDLHSVFGNWTTAVAAYNVGQNGMLATVRYQMTHDYYDLHLNDQTSRFIFRIVAIKQIMSHYRRYGFDLNADEFYPAPQTKLVDVGSIYNLAAWARQQGTTYQEVKYLNPWVLRRVLPAGRWTIELPASCHPVLLATSIEPGRSDSSGTTTYVVKEGDSLVRIAQRYGLTVNDLTEMNNLPQGRYLMAGQKLLVPASASNLGR